MTTENSFSSAPLTLPSFLEIPFLRHGFSTRLYSSSEALDVITVRQVHGNRVVVVREGPFNCQQQADALVTRQNHTVLAIRTADCLPLLVVEPQRRVVAAVHGGWRSLAAGIVANTLEVLREEFGAKTEDLLVGMGPGIGACCFEVGADVVAAFAAVAGARQHFRSLADPVKYLCDLKGIVKGQLKQQGMDEDQIAEINLCTKCRKDLFYSYRRDPQNPARQLNFIGLVPQSI